MLVAVVSDTKDAKSLLTVVEVTNENERSLGIIVSWRNISWRYLNDNRLLNFLSTSHTWYEVGHEGSTGGHRVRGVFDTAIPEHCNRMHNLLGRDRIHLSLATA